MFLRPLYQPGTAIPRKTGLLAGRAAVADYGGMTQSRFPEQPVVGFIGLGDQGLPMATAIAEAGFPLHAWARRPTSLDGLAEVPHQRHGTLAELAAACDIVCLCVGTDDDVLQLAERRLTVMVGGPQAAAEQCTPAFRSFSRHVVHLGDAGAGQTAKLFNNALLMMNQAAIAEIVELAIRLGLDPARLVEVLMLGSAASAALSLLNTMVRPDNVDHLASVEALDMELFDQAMRQAGIDPTQTTARGLAGAHGLTQLVHRLNA
jgi:3-hydroxyisobutyrate dehydrogenase-like beta-hydroxyacid dehydrogenase